MASKVFKFAGFISYCHEDKKWAKRLQSTLEGYQIPTQLLEECPELAKIRLICRDETDLPAGGALDERIQTALRESRKLIFIASPTSARKKRPNQEVSFFAGLDVSEDNPLGRIKDIIPVVIHGQPNSSANPLEYYPESLRKIVREVDLYTINLADFSYDMAVSKIIATLIDVDPNTLWQRHKRAEKRKRHERLGLVGIITLLLVCLLFGLGRLTGELRSRRHRQIAQEVLSLTEKGDVFLARQLLLDVIPKKKDGILNKEPALAWALFSAMNAPEGIIHLPEPLDTWRVTDSGTLLTTSFSSTSRVAFLREWDLNTGSMLKENDFEFSHGDKREVKFIFSPDGTRLFSDDGVILDVDTFTPITEVEGIMSTLSGMSFSPDGRLIAGSDFRSLNIWNAETGKIIAKKKNAFRRDWTVLRDDATLFSPDGSLLAFTPAENGVGIVNLNDPSSVMIIPSVDSVRLQSSRSEEKNAEILPDRLLGFSADSKRLFTRNDYGTAKIWDIHSGNPSEDSGGDYVFTDETMGGLLKAIDEYSISVKLSPDSYVPVMIHPRVSWDDEDHSGPIISSDTSRNGRFRAIADHEERVLRIYNNRTGELIAGNDTLPAVGQLKFSPDSRILLSFGMDETVMIFNSKTGRLTDSWDHYEGADIIFSPKKNLLASWDYKNNVYVLDYHGKQKAYYPIDYIYGMSINNLKFNHDGKILACATTFGSLFLWDTSSWKQKTIKEPDSDIKDICFSPYGKVLASLNDKGTVSIWDPDTGDRLWQLLFPVDRMDHIEFSDDGKSIIVSAWDNEAWSWSLPDFSALARELWSH